MEIKILDKVLAANDAWAAENRVFLKERGIRMLNLIGSPGSGKTTLLEATIEKLKGNCRIGVIEGDIATTRDAERIQKKGVPVYQINTGTACHLDAHLVHAALKEICLDRDLDLVFVENIGNLVCPAEFDIGESAKVAVLSVTEGDDKVEKYPLLFSEAKFIVISKMDLLGHTNFRMDAVEKSVRIINKAAPICALDSLSSVGMEPWLDYVRCENPR